MMASSWYFSLNTLPEIIFDPAKHEGSMIDRINLDSSQS